MDQKEIRSRIEEGEGAVTLIKNGVDPGDVSDVVAEMAREKANEG
jgi:hypothetical protein